MMHITLVALSMVTTFSLHAQNAYLKFDHLSVSNGLPQNTVHSIVKDKFGFMWFGTWSGACRYDGYTFKVFRSNNDSTSFADNFIAAIAVDSILNLWMQTGEQDYLYQYNYESETFKRFTIEKVPHYIIQRIEKARTQKALTAQSSKFYFSGTHSGLLHNHIQTGKQTIYRHNIKDPFSISDNYIFSIYVDDQENLWVGTRNGGVNHSNLNIKAFNYYHADEKGIGLIDNGVRAICKDNKGRIWIGSEDLGVSIYDPGEKNAPYSYIDNKKLCDNNIRSVYCDSKGFVWIGSKGGIDRFDPQANTFKHYPAYQTGSIPDPNVFAITEDHEGIIWIGTLNGLARYDRRSDRMETLSQFVTGGMQIRSILEDRRHNIWVATEDKGITKLVRTSSNNPMERFKPKQYIHEVGNANTLINNRTYSLAEDKNGMIWIATNSGLSRLNPIDNTFKHFTTKNGLPNDMVMAALFDGKESIWVSHKKGLTRININTLYLQSFNMYDGLQSDEFSQNACFVDSTTGEMFFGGTNGLNSFFPDSIKINQYKPRVVFTRLNVMNQEINIGAKVNDRVLLNKSLQTTDTITLTWWEKTFNIEFAALHYANPSGNKYKYKLDGIDREWILTDASRRTASYSHLPAGRYTLMVFAANSDGIWCDEPAALNITILPPWWLSWWAVVFYIIILGITIWFIYKYIISQIEFQKNEEIHQSKLQFFTGISHEFRTPLTLMVDPLEKLIAGDVEKDTAKQYYVLMHRNAKQLLQLINQLLDFRKLESGHLTLNPQDVDIVGFIRTVASSFEDRAKERGILFTLQTSVDMLLMSFDSAKLNMVLNNLLSNAFKFTPDKGEIEVTIKMVEMKGHGVEIKVRDTGVGIPIDEQHKVFEIFYQSKSSSAKHEGSGIGLALTKELVKLHGGDISVESQVGLGSCFSIFLPISESDEVVAFSDDSTIATDMAMEILTPSVTPKPDLPIMLVVDDNADIRHYIDLNFNKTYQIILAANGNEGFLRATETIPDIVVSDIMMPDVDGLQFCRMLKTDERTSHIPVILLTARQSDESKKEGYETGADAYVTKPFNTTVLQAQIKNLLEQRQRLRELFSHGSDVELKKISINITDEAFLKKVTKLVEENLEDENFNIDSLAEKLKMSRSQFYRKIKALTNQSLHDFVIALRMKKALEYLLSGDYNISQTAFKVGFSLPSNFSRTFTKHFGASPSQYIDSLRKRYGKGG
ncbi:MAG: two-component regulator propeller domain-containing protein [Bacteroidales bacterium]